jgi:hypothetical protein
LRSTQLDAERGESRPRTEATVVLSADHLEVAAHSLTAVLSAWLGLTLLTRSSALDSGVPAELHMCPGATHGKVIDTCPTEWGQWAVAFLNRAFNLH